jgi:sugar O-acyltransferase (sialic acid O-acetyltransferase NeuD family)
VRPLAGRDIVIFGTGQIAEVADFYFKHDSDYNVVAFTVDSGYISEDQYLGRPIVPFEEVAQRYPPAVNGMFIAVSYSGLNALRAGKFDAAKAMGYDLVSYVSSKATTFSGLAHGANCFILEDNTIQPFARIGDDVTLWSGNHIGHHSVIGDHCFLASHIVVSGGVEIGESCFIGVNVTIRDHVKVGAKCILGAGTLLLADAEDGGVYSPVATERSRVPSSRVRNI